MNENHFKGFMGVSGVIQLVLVILVILILTGTIGHDGAGNKYADAMNQYVGTTSDVDFKSTKVANNMTITSGSLTNGASSFIAGFYPNAAIQALSGAGAVNVTSAITNFTSTGASEALTLANGTVVGQLKQIVHFTDGGSGILTPTTFVDGTTITFATVGESVTLMWTASGWRTVAMGSGTASPVIA